MTRLRCEFQQKSEKIYKIRITFKNFEKTTTILHICSRFVQAWRVYSPCITPPPSKNLPVLVHVPHKVLRRDILRDCRATGAFCRAGRCTRA